MYNCVIIIDYDKEYCHPIHRMHIQSASPSLSIKLTPAVEDSSQLVGESSHHQREPLVHSFSLKIPTAHLKRAFSRAEGEGGLTGTASPESIISASECACALDIT